MGNEEEKTVSKFNMAQKTMERLNECLIRANKNYQDGFIRAWFFELRGIKMQVIAKLKTNERKELKDLEEKIKIKLSKKFGDAMASELIENYNERLQDLMESKGLLLVDRDDETVWT